jgi:hypothetical protein
MNTTYADIATRHQVELPAHLFAQAQIPVHSGPQRQGDLVVLPQRPGIAEGKPVQPEGVAVIRGENGGNTHLLTADGDVQWRWINNRGQDIGVVTVSEGAAAYLLHPEHGAQGFAPGEYVIRRQREQADEIRLVAD